MATSFYDLTREEARALIRRKLTAKECTFQQAFNAMNEWAKKNNEKSYPITTIVAEPEEPDLLTEIERLFP